MKNLKLETGAGDWIDDVVKRAKNWATERKQKVEFDFNGILCIVDENTVIDWLVRDYQNAHIMDWKEVGPDCKMEYDPDTKIELYTRKLERAKQQKADQEAYRLKEEQKQRQAESKVEGVEIELSDKEGWEKTKAANTDGYGGAVIIFAEAWAKLMQMEIQKAHL